MEPSPLTQQSRPESFKPKIVQLYETLFREDEEDNDLSEGFWQEFFLLRPDAASLKAILSYLKADDLLHLQAHSQQLFLQAISRIKLRTAPSDEVALDTLTVFLGAILSKKYTNPSSDIISVLAGLHDADAVMSDFVASLDVVIRNGRSMEVRQKAVRTALSITAGAYQTGLISYFTHRDLFPSLMKCVQDSENSTQAFAPFFLLGLLANYNKFEFQNPYRLRLDDFVNEAIIRKILTSFGSTCNTARDKYVSVQDDLPEAWSLGTTLNYIGLGVLAPGSRPTTPTPTPEEAKPLFSALPGPEAGILLATYEFVNANKLFCFNLVTLSPQNKGDPSPLSAFLSLTSYLFQHAHRSFRSSLYTYLNLFVLHIIIEDQALVKRMCSNDSNMSVRLCRQRQPYLPIVKGDRVAASVILDIMIDGINHNLRRKLDVDFYILCLGVILRIVSFLSRSRLRLVFHWSELWRTLLSFFRFLVTYGNDIKSLPRHAELIDDLVNLVALSLSNGEAFLPDPAAYDDLFYKLVEAGDILTRFRDAFELSGIPGSSSIDTLISVSDHYYSLLEGDGKGKFKSKNLSPREVNKVIKKGYETLSIQAKEGLDNWNKFREADHKTVLKKVARVAVEDAKGFLDEK
ncbi:DUF1741-domain-containing protein [Lepidopterella palustris CBS 459.81]|uniref:DUF1741-domain-containing protein n=1 Tax=Lepidopterella palustris CBS 459.81 TaxID=1314670 RepID=A0A8E2E996_9PEZI|nr:DUF1741-domain-containing protein [Lepidopterella palustris CBS 459.81]